MKISSAEFVCSNTRVDLCPKDSIPEYAFIGRSNVGKSSLINMLVERKKDYRSIAAVQACAPACTAAIER